MLSFHDSLERKLKKFKTLKRGKVTMYNCGPTVYGYVHIGNLRSFVFADILRRYLEFKDFDVTQIMNITDVGHMLADADVGEDKMEVAAKEAGKTPEEVAEFYTEAFFKDIDKLNIRRATSYPKATANVPQMIAIIETLLEKGHAYKVEHDGGVSVYYDITTFKNYGNLSGNKIEALDAGARVEVRAEKRNPGDFALWIYNPKHMMQWETPWGKGYPGWHIECSAMAKEYLGDTIDIHTGGEDNKFPHHECEIAQSEGATGKTFVGYWLHVTHLLVEGKKMSKSTGNFYTLQDLLDKGHDARSVRYLLLSSHYRQTLNFTLDGLSGAGSALQRIDDFADLVRRSKSDEKGKKSERTVDALDAFEKALDNDIAMSDALAVVFDYIHDMNTEIKAGSASMADLDAAQVFLNTVGDVLGFTFGRMITENEIPESIMELVRRREVARSEKRFDESDRLRDEIQEKGYVLEDSAEGAIVKRG